MKCYKQGDGSVALGLLDPFANSGYSFSVVPPLISSVTLAKVFNLPATVSFNKVKLPRCIDLKHDCKSSKCFTSLAYTRHLADVHVFLFHLALMEFQVRKSTTGEGSHIGKGLWYFTAVFMTRALTTQRTGLLQFFASISLNQLSCGFWIIQVHFVTHTEMDGLLQERDQTGVFNDSFLKKCIKDKRSTYTTHNGDPKATTGMQIGTMSWKQKLSHEMSFHMQFKRDLCEIHFRKLFTYISTLQVPSETFLWKYIVQHMNKSVLGFMVPYTES